MIEGIEPFLIEGHRHIIDKGHMSNNILSSRVAFHAFSNDGGVNFVLLIYTIDVDTDTCSLKASNLPDEPWGQI